MPESYFLNSNEIDLTLDIQGYYTSLVESTNACRTSRRALNEEMTMNELHEKLTSAARSINLVVKDLEAALKLLCIPQPRDMSVADKIVLQYVIDKTTVARCLRSDLLTVLENMPCT